MTTATSASPDAPSDSPPDSPAVTPGPVDFRTVRCVALDVAIALAIVGVSSIIGARTNLPYGITTLWLPGGLLIAVFVTVAPWRWVPGVVLGTVGWFVFFHSSGWSPGASLVRAAGEIAAVVVVALGVRGCRCLPLRSVTDIAWLTAWAAGAGALRVVVLWLASSMDAVASPPFADLAGSLMLNALLGVLVVAPFGTALAVPPRWRRPSRLQWEWGLLLAGMLLLFAVLQVAVPSASWWTGAEFLVFPLMIIAVLALPLRALACWLMAVSIVGTWAVIGGRGPFFRSAADAGALQADSFRAQALLIVLTMTAWTLYVLRDSWNRASAERDQATRRLHAAVDQAAVPMAFGPLVGGPIEANRAMAAFFQMPAARLPHLDWLALTHPDDVAEDVRLTESVLSGQADGYRHLKRYVLEDGTLKWGDVTVVRIDDGQPTPWGVVQVVDMTAEQAARRELERSEGRLRALVDQASIPMSYGPIDNGLAYCNEARRAFHELTREELEQADYRDLIHPEDLAAMQPLHEQFLRRETDRYRVVQRFVMPDGRIKWGDKTVARLDLDGDGDELVVVQIVDVTPEIQARQRLQHLVDTEEITGLGSRSWITTALQRALDGGGGVPGTVAAMFVDLSEYGVVTRTLGYEAGDEVLARLATVVADSLPPTYQIGRFWGDRLLVVAPNDPGVAAIEEVAQRILRGIAAEQVVRGNRIARTGAIGIAVSSRGSTATSMLRTADQALAQAIQAGRSRWHLTRDDTSDDPGSGVLQREHHLREALERGQFLLHYQPQVRMADGRVCGYEALVRWQHPERGLLGPAEFLDLMESSGLIVDLGRNVLGRACADLAAAPWINGPVSVNVSALEITEPDWLDRLTDTVQASGVPADRLTLELTETTVLRLTPDARAALSAVREMGMGLHIDDFGSGYASIGALQQVPLTGLKLDRSFVSALGDPEQDDLDLVASIASMAKGLRLEPIAEGIETPRQATLLKEAGWIYGQGYLYGRPAPLPRGMRHG